MLGDRSRRINVTTDDFRSQPGSAEDAGIGVLIKADQQGFSDSGRRCPQVAGWSEHGLDGVCRRLAADREFLDLLAFCDNQPRYIR